MQRLFLCATFTLCGIITAANLLPNQQWDSSVSMDRAIWLHSPTRCHLIFHPLYWQQSCSQVVHSQNSLLIAPHPFLLSVYVMEAYSKPLVLSFPNICFGFALKSWMSLPPPQFHRMTPVVQFCLIWEDILEQSGEGSHNSSACYVKLLAGRKFHQQPWWCLVTVTWWNTATHSALQRQMSKLDCFWLLTFFMPL